MVKKGLTGNQLKWIGLVLMVCDHIHQMFYYAGDLTWLSMLGRLVMPIFLFTCAEGYHYTRSKRQYAIRLTLWAIGMRFATILVSQTFPITAHSVELMNNVFATMAVSVVVMMAVDAFRLKQFGKGFGYLFLPAIPLLFVVVLMQVNQWEMARLFAALPSYLAAEGGPIAILMAVLFYIWREKRARQLLLVLFIGLLNIFLARSFDLTSLLTTNLQWMMIFSIPLLALYNGQRGGGNKYFFYIFYPTHLYLLYVLAYILLEKGILS
jgi:hypothetical protein